MLIDGNSTTVMLTSKQVGYDLAGLDYEKALLELGGPMAETVAQRLGGTVKRVWFDNGAGGLFCEIERKPAVVPQYTERELVAYYRRRAR